ncbi:MAG: alpha-mannosidase [Treponema sp.]|nr:alpha-mannosidase [Treponema sp.]
MRYRKERAQVYCRELLQLTTVQSADIKGWKMKDGLYWSCEEADNACESWQEFETGSEKWTGRNRNSWFSVIFTVPQSFGGKPLSFNFYTQAQGWDARNPQFLLFINGSAACGLDVNHKDIFVTENAKAGDSYRIDLQGFTGSELSEIELTAKAVQVSPDVMRLYYDLNTVLGIIKRLSQSAGTAENNKTQIELETAAEKVINAIDLREPHSETFYASLEKAFHIVKEEVYTKFSDINKITATCVGHTHIDVAWWWTVAQTRQKAVRSFATALRYIDEYPDFIFMSSQPQLYKFVKEHQPLLYKRIRECAAEGRWEAEGGMWLEADCNLTSGESLVRQFLYGKRFFKEEFGIDSRILWLPDVFGYSAALPQIMKLCGIDYFMTTKLSWNQFNRMPYDTFWWRGTDGSEVFTHMITTTGAKDPMEQYFTTYNGNLCPNEVMGAWERYQQKELNNDVLIAYGYGDGGGGPTREMIETGLRLSNGAKAAPSVRFATARQYFDELYEKLKDNKKLPKWTGELYFEYHRGTYTSMARNKRSNRKCEFLLQDLEFISVLANDLPYPKPALDEMWETLLLNQFHDILPGSSIKEVYDVTKREYAELHEHASILINERLNVLADKTAGDLFILNTLGFLRSDIVQIPGDINAQSLVNNGKTHICQKTADGSIIAYISDIPAKGFLGIHFGNSGSLSFSAFAGTTNPILIDGLKIDTPFYSAEFDKDGFITKLFFKEAFRDVLQASPQNADRKIGNELRVYEDKPMNYDNWDIDIYYTEKSWLLDDTVCVEWIEKGPVRAALLVERRFLKSVIRQKIYFYTDIPRIDFESYADWQQSQLLLRTHFHTDIKTPEATYDIQFGNVTRPAVCNTSWDEARFETCAHKWADLSEGNYGVSLLNDCKYGHDIHDGIISLTLIKSGIVPNPETDREEHFFTYSLLPHMGSWREGGTVKNAYCLNVPVYTRVKLSHNSSLQPVRSFIRTDCKNVMVETIKKAEDSESIIVRMYEFENIRTKTVITLCQTAIGIYVTDCLENRKTKIASNTNEFIITLLPYEIKTLELVFT